MSYSVKKLAVYLPGNHLASSNTERVEGNTYQRLADLSQTTFTALFRLNSDGVTAR
jgi:hypothetical protein